MLAVFRRSGFRVTSHAAHGVVELELLFDAPAVAPTGRRRWGYDRGRTSARGGHGHGEQR
jgi:hypothetical protein